MDIVARAHALAEYFAETEVEAFHDPAVAVNNRPCLLIAPPVIDWTEGTITGAAQVQWPVYALSSHPAGTLDAVAELSDLVEVANEVLEIETARPVRYQVNDKTPLIAAYLCTHTEIQ